MKTEAPDPYCSGEVDQARLWGWNMTRSKCRDDGWKTVGEPDAGGAT